MSQKLAIYGMTTEIHMHNCMNSTFLRVTMMQKY